MHIVRSAQRSYAGETLLDKKPFHDRSSFAFTAGGHNERELWEIPRQYPVDTGRLRRVVEVAERSGWVHKKPGQGRVLVSAAQTHVHLLPSHDLPASMGEPGVPQTIPALCNALFVATGKRIRQLPIMNTKLT